MRIRRRFKVVIALLAALGLATLLLLVAFAVALTGLAAAAWRSPVPGAVTRSFDPGRQPFEAGRHRGIDLAAAPGTPVRAPCGGPVAFAGRVGTSGLVVTVRCGPWRVTHMPLASLAVRAGATVGEGALLGTVAQSRDHHGLHLGVRREGTRFGYADPLRFLAPARPTPPPLGRAPRPIRTRPGPPTARPVPVPPRPVPQPRPIPAPPRPGPQPRPIPAPLPPAAKPLPAIPPRPLIMPRRFAAPRLVVEPPRPVVPPGRVVATPTGGSNPRGSAPVAPWPVWFGLALVLAGAGVRWRGRARRGGGWIPEVRRQPVR